jgi:hypothetical protein
MLAGSIKDADIVIEEPEQVNYEEIVKELYINNAFLKSSTGLIMRIHGIDYNDNTFHCNIWNDFEYIKELKISFDLKTFYSFNEYLELRRKQ